MKRTVIGFVGFGLTMGTLALFAASTKVAVRPKLSPAASRGKYLVSILGCNDCHTPKKMGARGPEPDTGRLLIGYVSDGILPPPPPPGPWLAHTNGDLTAWAGPWGVSYAKNLTPDENTGIGSWSEETFIKAIRTGKHMGVSRPILPPMPWADYGQMTDSDLKAVYAFLRTIPAVNNPTPEPVPPQPEGTAR